MFFMINNDVFFIFYNFFNFLQFLPGFEGVNKTFENFLVLTQYSFFFTKFRLEKESF